MTLQSPPPFPARSSANRDEYSAAIELYLAWLSTAAPEVYRLAVAMSLNATNSTSNSSVSIGSGSKSFIVQPNKSYVPGMTVMIRSALFPTTKYMIGVVGSYDEVYGGLLVDAVYSIGSGTESSWTIQQSSPFDLAPVGSIIAFAGNTVPAGFLACPTVATNVSRTTYAALFAVIGTLWGVGDGSTTFGLPHFPAGYTTVQGGTVGQTTSGSTAITANAVDIGTTVSAYGASPVLAAGRNVKFCIKY